MSERFRLGMVLALLIASAPASAEETPNFTRDVQPILKRYCSGCHGEIAPEGGFNADSYDGLTKGSTKGPAYLPGDSASSRIVRLITGEAEPKMPPDDEPAPKAEELALLRAWIDAGAPGPDGSPPPVPQLIVPHVKPAEGLRQPITALAISPDGTRVAVARFGEVTIQNAKTQETIAVLGEHPGKVNSVAFSADGKKLVTASGVTGLYGVATIWNVDEAKIEAQFQGHRDVLYDAELSPDGKTLATASYDAQAILWDVKTGQPRHTLKGHNGAIYDLAISPDSQLIVTASGDETCKVWSMTSGERLDTLGQPEGEQYSVAFSPDGKFIAAGGADHRIRIWKVVSKTGPKINPLVFAQFAHEGSILRLAYTSDGAKIVSVSDDREAKLWHTNTMQLLAHWPGQSDVAEALAILPSDAGFVLGQLDGQIAFRTIDPSLQPRQRSSVGSDLDVSSADLGEIKKQNEQEPNNSAAEAQIVELPAEIAGAIRASGAESNDTDVYRFSSKQGEQWVIETNAARSKSPLDSKIEILSPDGQPLPRVMLQATRDSYFTFRGKDSNTSDDFRIHNWQEMELNEYLYSDGEVVRLWLFPRGPDSGFKVYPGRGNRHTFFGTTATAHALGAPCWIVRPWSPDAEIPENGLPVFPIYWENDDDTRRELGKDSRLIFTAPRDGDYLVRVSDVRGFQSEKHKYTLTVRPAKPHFRVKLTGLNNTIPRGAGREFQVQLDRIDGYDGAVTVEIDGLPEGFSASGPIVIEAEQTAAVGTITARADASEPNDKQDIKVRATAEIRGETVAHDVGGLGPLKLGEKPKLLVRLLPAQGDPVPEGELVVTLKPGETTSARVRVERANFGGLVEFGKEDSGRNLPFAVFVDNIGLNGLLIPAGQTEQEFFITASPVAEPGERRFHLRATNVDGGVTSVPATIKILEP
jgi:WD40 repeat protein